jgi:hypothetical protein
VRPSYCGKWGRRFAAATRSSTASGRRRVSRGDVVGREDARRYGALLMSSTHGIASMDLSGHLSKEKWNTNARTLVALLADALPRHTLS